MRILMLGAGVIGSVYAGYLSDAGHQVTLVARGQRFSELQTSGLVLQDARTGQRRAFRLPTLATVDDRQSDFDVAFVAVRREQFATAVSSLSSSGISCDAVLFGNTAGLTQKLTSALGTRALVGFPAAGGVRDGGVIRYVLIRQQKTMLAEPDGTITSRIHRLAAILVRAGFPTTVSSDPEGWLLAHAAFVVPIAFALYRVGVNPKRLADDTGTLRLMVRATRQAFHVLQACGNNQIPRNLRALYLYAPQHFAVAYWRRIMASDKGELWFAGHTRAAPQEMTSLAAAVQDAVARSRRSTPDLAALLSFG